MTMTRPLTLAICSVLGTGIAMPTPSAAARPTTDAPTIRGDADPAVTDRIPQSLEDVARTRQIDPGLTVRMYEVGEMLNGLRPMAEGQRPNIDLRLETLNLDREGFGAIPAPFVTEVTGWLIVTEDGPHTFELTSDDGSRLMIGDEVIIDHDGRHGPSAKTSAALDLRQGIYPIRVDHFDAGGNAVLKLAWRTPAMNVAADADAPFVVIPSANLRCERDLTRVTAPGVKMLAGGRRPGDGVPLIDVHPAWRVETIRPEGFEPKVGALCLLEDGRLLVGTFDPLQRDDRSLPDIDSKPPDTLYAVTGWDSDDPADLAVREVATDLYEPAGACLLDGDLYVSHRRAVTKLTDEDGDGYFETHTDVARGWEAWNYHQFTFCLTPGLPGSGRLHAALSTSMAPPGWEGMQTNAGPNGPMRGGVLEIDVVTGDVRVIAGGTRTPNGLGRGPAGELLYSDNQGAWFPASTLSEVLPGRFYGHWNWTRYVPKLAERFPDGGHPSAYGDRPVMPPSIWLVHGEASNSPTVPIPIDSGPFAGQVLLGELTAGGLRRVSLQRVDGVLQGAVYRHSQGFESGINRIVAADDGSLIVGGIGAGGNWKWRETQYGLQRLVPIDAPAGGTPFEIHSVRATPDGFAIRFTESVEDDWLATPSNYELRHFHYEPTAEYGGPKVDEERLVVRAAIPTGDNRGVNLVVDGLEPGRVVHLHLDPSSETGRQIRSPEAWYTLHRIPRAVRADIASIGGGLTIRPTREGIEGRPYDGLGVGILPPPDAVPMINRSGAPLMRFGDRSPAIGWNRSGESLVGAEPFVAVGKGSGNLVSAAEFGDCRLHVEWFSPEGGEGQLAGNSGVYLQDRYEIQVLGTPAGADAPAINEAGAIYNFKRPDANASTGPGTWQAYDIFFRAARFDEAGTKTEDARVTLYWNGVLVHDDVAIQPTGSRASLGETPAPGLDRLLGPLHLQDHASGADGPVRYRNVWIAPLDVAPASAWRAGPWVPVFHGSGRNAVARGGKATYTFEVDTDPAAGPMPGPVITGTTAPNTPNTFLTTIAEYEDFELVYEFKVDAELNAGVQIRSRVAGDPDDRTAGLAGLQVEVDPSDRAWSAGIYDERGRAWLAPLHDAPHARRAFRADAWNRVHVIARGPVVRTWINGVPAADLFDARSDQAGSIGLQVHGVGGREDPLQVQYRRVRIRPLTPPGTRRR